MMSFFYSVTAYFKSALSLYAPVKLDLLDTSTDSICFRFIPVAPAHKMFDGGIRNIQFQILTKSKNQEKAFNTINIVRDALELNNGELRASDFTLIKCECYSEPSFVEKTGASEFIYTALFKAEIEEV